MARFSKHRWPAEGPVRELLSYLDELHREQGQPSMAQVGKAVRLAAGTVSAFFTGSRLIGREHLRELVVHLGGDSDRAERLRRAAATAWNEQRAAGTLPSAPTPQSRLGSGPVIVADSNGTSRLDVIIFNAPVNRLNRPELMVGRQAVIDAVNGWLDNGDRVVLYGLGGSGKTALAATIADRRVDAGKGPYLWLRTAAADEDITLDAMARCLSVATGWDGVLPAAGDGRLLGLARQVGAAGIGLCVIDDVWNASALHTVLRAIPATTPVLVTSRLKIGVEYQVEVEGLDATEATRLLAHHAREDGYAAHPDALALCHDLSYHPYLIEIAGHHLRQYSLTPAQLRRRIDGAPHELEMPAGFAAPGRENARRLLDTTYERLPHEDARAAVAAFGALFSGSMTPELLSRYLGIGFNRSLAALNALVDASLAKRAAGSGAYAIHDLTMGYARAVLHDSGDNGKSAIVAVREFVTTHHHDHEVLALDLDNIVSTAERACDTAVDDFIVIVETMATCGYIDTHGHTLALVRLIDAAIDVMRGTPYPERLHYLLSKRGNASYNQGDFETAVNFYQEALALAPGPQRRVILLSVIGKVLAERGLHSESDECFDQAYAIAAAEADEAGTMRILEQHSVAAFRQRDYARVRDIAEHGVELSRRLGERAIEATFLNNLGTAHFEIGVEAGLRHHQQAMAIAKESNDEHILALTKHCVGIDYHAMERYDDARAHLDEALRLYERLGQTQRMAKVRNLMRRFGYLS